MLDEHDDIWTVLPFSFQDCVDRRLGVIRDLRNQAAHDGNLLRSMDADLPATGREIIGLKETDTAIVAVLGTLRDRQSGDPTDSE